jgi:hypothetical protein
VGFEPTIPVLEQAKTVQALDGTATVMGSDDDMGLENARKEAKRGLRKERINEIRSKQRENEKV